MKDNIVTVQHLSFTYKDTKHPAVNDVSFNIPKGSWTTLVGHNGSGKSTIARLLDGILLPDENSETLIQIDGITLNEKTMWDIRDKVGIVFQNPDNQFVGATVEDDVAFGLENRQVPRLKMQTIVHDVINRVGMLKFQKSEPQYLSGGQKQRVAIAGILAIGPKLIILDESTSMLDPAGKDKILALIKKVQKENGLTIFSITHDINEASQADQILVLNQGTLLASGSPIEIFKDESLIKSAGLELPLFYKVKNKLIKRGIAVPQEIDNEKKLVNYLCQLNLKM
ncbi:energy-coupling factor transporter ATPase [Lactobacillus taiwanensis]|jgi:ABC-type cobalt transport system, ATPase component|uniref:energy-coupling factor transporter ATPase n=1 Tax=Lactobacillus taiwanensis TaxID=508451 RepID=UPI0025AFA3D0|nr:energy-coupling factor transporter ATPase [Lactobacillus taiwanensis]